MRILVQNEPKEPSAPTSGRGERRRWNLSLVISLAAHAVAVMLLVWQGPAIFVKPRLLARGEGGTATPVAIALTWPKNASSTPTSPALLSLPSPASERQKTASKLRKRSNELENTKLPDLAEAGSRQGSALDGPVEGDEVRPGFAITFNPPRISRWELPGGKEGDVIVELTIDAQGNVVDERLLQGLGGDVDQRVIAMLRVWRFRPATRNGIAIPFKYDARFHFPS